MALSRRDVIKLSALGATAMALPLERAFGGQAVLANRMAESALPAPFTIPFTIPNLIYPERSDATTDYYRVTMQPFLADVLPGLKTPMWGYNGQAPGPTFQVTRGRPAVARMINNLPEVHPDLGYTPWTSVHLHGSASLPQFDGYASDICNPGWFKDYQFPNKQVARTLWYHDHGAHHTAQNVYMGLAGMYVISDPVDQSLPIPKGTYDVPLIVDDKMFASDGKLLFSPMETDGFYGDVICVNGRPWPTMKVARRKYRFRILNASVSRSYKWSLGDGSPMTIIATDAGLMPRPVPVTSFRHAAAERYEVIIDFARYAPGTRIVLRNASPKNNFSFKNTDKVMAFDVVDDSFSTSNNEIPSVLAPDQPTLELSESQSVKSRRIDFVRAKGLWTINRTTWDDVVRSDFTKVVADPKFNDVEIWELRNRSGGWHHPVHIHLVDFKILTRNGQPPMPHERGAKDVVFLGENETVRLLMKFDQGRGRYMVHCHNLVHEDHDMMAQFLVRDDTVPEHDPRGYPGRRLPDGPL